MDISSAPTFTMPAKEKHTKSFVLLNQNVALNKTSGGSFYRKSMQGGMCDVMAYKNDHGDQSYVSWANQDGSTYIFCIMQSPDTCDTYATPTAARPSMRRPASSTGCSRAFPSTCAGYRPRSGRDPREVFLRHRHPQALP